MVNNYTIVITDFDYTIIKDSSWRIAIKCCGNEKKKSRKFLEEWKNRYLFEDKETQRKFLKVWMIEDLKYIQPSCVYSERCRRVLKSNLVEGVKEFFDFLRNQGDKIVFASLGFTPIIQEFYREYLQNYKNVEFCTHEIIRKGENFVVKRIITTHGKVEITKKYRKMGYPVVYIGDGPEDLEAMRNAELGFLMLNGEYLQHHPGERVIAVRDFWEVLEYYRRYVRPGQDSNLRPPG